METKLCEVGTCQDQNCLPLPTKLHFKCVWPPLQAYGYTYQRRHAKIISIKSCGLLLLLLPLLRFVNLGHSKCLELLVITFDIIESVRGELQHHH